MPGVLAVGFALLALGACAGQPRAVVPLDTAGAASPGPALTGTWKGTAWAVPGSAYFVSTPVRLTIRPDGTFEWSRGSDDAVARGVVRGVTPDRILLQEHVAQTAEEQIELQRTGDRLWGMSSAFMAGHPTAVQLEKVEE